MRADDCQCYHLLQLGDYPVAASQVRSEWQCTKALALITQLSSAAWRPGGLNGHYTVQSDGKLLDQDALVEGLELGDKIFWGSGLQPQFKQNPKIQVGKIRVPIEPIKLRLWRFACCRRNNLTV